MRLSRSIWLSMVLLWGSLSGCHNETPVVSGVPALSSADPHLFQLAKPTPSVNLAAQVQLWVRSPDPLPATIQVEGVTFVAVPISGLADQLYVPKLLSATQPLQPISAIRLPGVTEATLSAVTIEADPTTHLIFQDDPTAVTLTDFVLVLALASLPPNLRSPEAIAAQANSLFFEGGFSAEALDPIPTEFNTNFVLGGSFPAPDLTDAAVVYAATFLPTNLRTPETLAATVNALLPGSNLVGSDILAIPGQGLPGGLSLQPPLGPVAAGTLQISIQVTNFTATNFAIGPAEFIRLPEIFPGFTTYIANPESTLLSIELRELIIPDLDPLSCVIIHQPGQNPLDPESQIAVTPGCSLEAGIRFSEAIDGDISDDRMNPTTVTLSRGTNQVTAAQQGDPRDLDYLTVVVPDGFELSGILLANYVAEPFNLAFLGVQSGSSFTFDAAFPIVNELLGGITFGSDQIGTDILEPIGQLPGAIGFTGPLPSGSYTFWFNQTGLISTTTLNLVVQ